MGARIKTVIFLCFAVPIIFFITDFLGSAGRFLNLFSRSGALLVCFAVFLSYKKYILDQSKTDDERHLFPYDKDRHIWLGKVMKHGEITLLICGTLIWAYGDMLFLLV